MGTAKRAPAAKTETAPETPFDRVVARIAALGAPHTERSVCEDAGMAVNLLTEARRKSEARAAPPVLSLEALTAFAKFFGCTVGELLGEQPAPDGRSGVRMLAFNNLVPSPLNPRKTGFEDEPEELNELAESIAEKGVLQTLLARPAPDDSSYYGRPTFELIAGERRYRAIKSLVLQGRWDDDAPVIPVMVREASDAEATAMAVIENLQRKQVPPLQEAEAFAKLRALDPETYTNQWIARSIGKTDRYVQQALTLVTRLAAPVREALASGQISKTDATALTLVAPERQEKLLAKRVNRQYGYETAEKMLASIRKDLPRVGAEFFDRADYTGGYEMVADWEGQEPSERFSDRDQFEKLQEAAVAARLEALKAEGWAWVKLKSGVHFPEHEYERVKGKNKKAGGAILFRKSMGSGEEIEVHTGLVTKPKEKPATEGQGGPTQAQLDIERAAYESILTETVAVRRQLADALGRSPDTVRRLLLLALTEFAALGQNDGGSFVLAPEIATAPGHKLPCQDEMVALGLWPEMTLDDDGDPVVLANAGPKTEAERWAIIKAMDSGAVEALIYPLLAGSVSLGLHRYRGHNAYCPATLDIAGALGVTIPPGMLAEMRAAAPDAEF